MHMKKSDVVFTNSDLYLKYAIVQLADHLHKMRWVLGSNPKWEMHFFKIQQRNVFCTFEKEPFVQYKSKL